MGCSWIIKGQRRGCNEICCFLTFCSIALHCSCQKWAAASCVPLPFPSFAERGQLCFLIMDLSTGQASGFIVLLYPNSTFSLPPKWHDRQLGLPTANTVPKRVPGDKDPEVYPPDIQPMGCMDHGIFPLSQNVAWVLRAWTREKGEETDPPFDSASPRFRHLPEVSTWRWGINTGLLCFLPSKIWAAERQEGVAQGGVLPLSIFSFNVWKTFEAGNPPLNTLS